MNDEQRKDTGKWTRPFGLHSEIGASGVAALENRTTNACARRLAQRKFKRQISRRNARSSIFETASRITVKSAITKLAADAFDPLAINIHIAIAHARTGTNMN